jgi:hypothetical protein
MNRTPTRNVLSKALDLGMASSGNTQALDTLGFQAALITLVATTGSASTLDAKLQESSDNSTWVDVTGGAVAQVVASQTRATRTISVELVKTIRRRYLRLNYTVSGTVTGAVTAGLYGPERAPVSQDNTTVLV